ncbi:MAG: 50S ribosomal protein L5, partial [Candidatus Woesebacteria bacterium GW2011_GWD1_38_10]
MQRLQEKYTNETLPILVKEFAIKNTLQAPRIEKVVLNTGIGDAQK